jgi:hypothetical protein
MLLRRLEKNTSLYFTWILVFYLSYNVYSAADVPEFDILNVFSLHTNVYSELSRGI